MKPKDLMGAWLVSPEGDCYAIDSAWLAEGEINVGLCDIGQDVLSELLRKGWTVWVPPLVYVPQ